MKKIFCLLTLIFFLSSVYSFECLGVVDSNSLMCKDSNTNLDQNYSISLIDSYLDCNIKKKCEWYCKSGYYCLLYTSPSPRDRTRSRMPSSA